MNYLQSERLITVTTPLAPDVLLPVGMSGREAISRPFEFQLDLIAENGVAVPFDGLLGGRITILVASADGRGRRVDGVCSSFDQGERDHTFTAYRMTVVPQLWFLTKRTQSRIFQRESVPKILGWVFEGMDVASELRETYHPREFCVQYRETDFAFASRLMEEEGIYYHFRHTAQGHTMVLVDSPGGPPDVPGQGRAIFDEARGGLRQEDRIVAWRKSQEVIPGRYSIEDSNFELPDRKLVSVTEAGALVRVGGVTHDLGIDRERKLGRDDSQGHYGRHCTGIDPEGAERPDDLRRVSGDGERATAIRKEQEAARSLVIRGAGNCRQFAAGHRFTLERHPDADGPYLLTEVRHDCQLTGNYRSGMGGLDYRNEFTCIPLDLPFRAPQATPRPVVSGPQTAVVVGPPGEEISTDKYGRVKVRFRWDRRGEGGSAASCWIRVAQASAGGGFGTIFIPRVGQEVIVQFEDGNPDRPLITGCVYNPSQMPPYPLPGGRMIAVVRTVTYPGGGGMNEFSMDDTRGEERMFQHAQYNHDVVVGNDSTTEVGRDVVGTVGRDRSERIGSDQKITIGGESTLDVTGQHRLSAREITISASERVSITCGGSSIVLEAGQVTINSPMVKINC